jgi:hypothetical protein
MVIEAGRRRTLIPALVVSFAATLIPPAMLVGSEGAAVAQPKSSKDEARTRFERGKQLYEEGAFDAALTEFQRAYELSPSYRILYNIGQVYRQTNDYAGALRSYERYLAEGKAEIDAKRRSEVEQEVSQLRARVATLQISVNVPGAEVSVDDVSVGKSPISQGVTVNAGRRRVTATREGKVPVAKVVTVAGSDVLKVELELTDTSAQGGPAPPASSQVAPPKPPVEESKTPWLGWALTGAFGVGAAIGGVVALGASSDLKDQRDKPSSTRSSLDDARSKVKTTALVTDILLGATILTGGISLYLTFRSPSKDTSRGPSAPPSGAFRLGIGPGAVSLGGDF